MLSSGRKFAKAGFAAGFAVWPRRRRIIAAPGGRNGQTVVQVDKLLLASLGQVFGGVALARIVVFRDLGRGTRRVPASWRRASKLVNRAISG